jgi:hypothetical protein
VAGLAPARFFADAPFLAEDLRAAVRFLAEALRPAALRPAALRAVPRRAFFGAADLRAPARFLAVDFRFALFFFPNAAPARRMAAEAARFIFFKAVAAPELLFLFLDFAMVDSSCCLGRHYGPNGRTTKHVRSPGETIFMPPTRAPSP